MRAPCDVTVSAPTNTLSTLRITERTALSMISVTSTPASARSLTVRIPCLQGRDSVAYTLMSFPCLWASLMTPRAALLLQCVMMTSPSWILRAPMRAISSTALSDLSQKAFALAETSALASSREDASDAPFTVACSPFHSETAVGLDARIVSLAPFRSARNPPRVPPVYVSAKSPSADAPALAILPAPRILMLRISSAVSSAVVTMGVSPTTPIRTRNGAASETRGCGAYDSCPPICLSYRRPINDCKISYC